MTKKRCPSGKIRLKGKCYELDKSDYFYPEATYVRVKKDVLVSVRHRGYDDAVVEVLQEEKGISHIMEKHLVSLSNQKYQERIDLIMRRAKLYYPQEIKDYNWQPSIVGHHR